MLQRKVSLKYLQTILTFRSLAMWSVFQWLENQKLLLICFKDWLLLVALENVSKYEYQALYNGKHRMSSQSSSLSTLVCSSLSLFYRSLSIIIDFTRKRTAEVAQTYTVGNLITFRVPLKKKSRMHLLEEPRGTVSINMLAAYGRPAE